MHVTSYAVWACLGLANADHIYTRYCFLVTLLVIVDTDTGARGVCGDGFLCRRDRFHLQG